MPELAVGYVSLVAETSKMGPAIKRALGQADGDAAAAGKSMGSKMSSALGTALKGGVATAGAAALGGIGFALTKGFSRLNTIDQAQAKLRALGSSGEEVESIMKNALAAVKGTSFGLGDAAGLAGTMVAAGIKPGQQLESTLRLVADSAAIAGTDLNDMGMIWGKIAAKGKLDGETLDQLMERQIGILPELAKNYGVTTEEAAKMVSEGKVSFEDFAKVMTEKVGGGAEEMGQTVQGAFENMKAAAGRIGATALEPIFKALPGGFSGITEAMDALEPKIGSFVEMISNKAVTEFGPKIRESAMAAWQALEGSGVIDQTRDTFMQLISTGQQLAPTVVRIATSIATVSASLGVGTWQVFMAALSGVASVMSALEPVFSTIADVMEAQPALVGAAIIGWMAFKSVPGMVTRVGTVTSSLTQRLSGLVRASALSAESESALAAASTRLAQAQNVAATAAAKVLIAEENLARVRATAGVTAGQVAAAEARVAEARLASTAAATRATAAQAGMTAAQAAAARQTQTFGSTVRQAYAQGAAGAQRFTRTAGVASAGMAGMRSAGAGLMGMMGGPWGVAMVGATVGVMAITSEMQKSKQKARELAEAQSAVESATRDTTVALRESAGAMSDGVVQAMSAQIESLEQLASKQGVLNNPSAFVGAKSLDSALQVLGMTMDDLSRAMGDSDAGWQQFRTNMLMANPAIMGFLPQLDSMRTKFLEQRDVASRVTPGVAEFGDAVKVLGDKSATASDKLNAIKTAMDALNPQRTKAEAMRQMGDAIRQTATAASEIGPSAFNAKGELDAMGESGGKLSEVLGNLAEKQQQVAATGDGAAIARTNQQIETSLQALADSTNKPIGKIRELYASFGGGENIDLMVKLAGAPEVVQEIGQIQAKLNATPDAKFVEFKTGELTQGTLDALDTLKVKVTTMPDGKTLRVDTTGDAGAKLQTVLNTVNQIPPGKAISVTSPGGVAVRDLLAGMNVEVNRANKKDVEVISPLAPGVLDLLHQIGFEVENRNGKNVIVRADDSDFTTKKANNKWTETEIKQIIVQANDLTGRASSSMSGIFDNADGSIRRYAAGGIQAAEAYANGGTRGDKLPDRALIQQADPGGGLVQWAEPSTHGEAFIPLAPGKRSRSTAILAAVAKMFGLELIPRDGSISGLLGGIAGGAVSKLLKSAGADGITRFADGGFNGKQLRELVDGGHGASRPLTGAPYVWGGVNWGDCCLTWDAPVWGPHGVKPIGLIEAGDYVWSYVDGKIESHQVTAQWFSKRQDVFKVRTRHRSVTGSANHPFLRVVQTAPAKPRVGRRGWDPAEYGVEWARLDELRRGDLLVQPKSVHLDREVSNTLPSGREIGLNEAWLLGVILGDGNVSDTKVEICVYGDLRDRVRGVLSGMHLDASKTRAERDGIGSSDSDSHGIRAYSTQFARELDEAGFRKPAYEKSIPECVWSWDEDRQRAFLNGYCDADGHHPKDVAHHGERTYASSSRRLIEDVRYLHITLGDVVANVSTNKRSKPITINGKRVKNARPLHSISVRPAGETLVASVAATARPGIVAWIDRGDFTVAPVLGVTAMGEADTYDIEVASSANFIAGGVVVHNSGAVSAPARAAAGLPPFGGRMSTGSMGSDLPAMGYQRGAGKSGDMRVAYYNGGPGGGHAVGRLPDDVNVEMGGQNGGGMVGGPVGPDHPQFTDRWYLTVAQALDNAVGTLTLDSTTDTPSATTDTPSATTDTPTTTSTPDTVSKESTISGLVGDVVKTGVSGQIKDILDVFGVNDSPGALAAWAGLPVKDVTSGKSVDPKKLREAQDKVTDKEAALKIARTQLDEAKKNKKLKPSQLLAAQGKVDRLERELGQAKDDLKALEESGTTTTATITPGKGVRDPGTHRPKRGEDTGTGKLSSVDAIKNAFKGGLREAWRSGDQWSATDWIVNKESTWKPDAQNGKYWGLIQAGEDVYRAAGVDPKTTDPAQQAKAFDKYVDGRYKTPVDAKAFHEANNWYDQGGIAPRKGLMLKNINTPERVLSPRQTSAFEQMVRRDFQSGIGTDVIVAKLDQLIKVVVAQGPNGVQPARDDRDFADKQRQKNRRLVAAGKGGRV